MNSWEETTMKLRSVLAMILAVVMLVACAAGFAEGKTTVTIWSTFTKGQDEYLRKAVADFNAQSAAYEVVVETQPNSGFTTAVRNAVQNGVGPDIIFNYASEAAGYVDQGLVADLSQYIYDGEIGIEGFDECMSERIMEGEVNGFSDGLVHYLPAYTTGPILFYNETLFNELELAVPTTWEEMEAACAVIKEKKGIAGLGFDSLTDCIQMMIMETGCGYIDTANKVVTFNTPEMVAKIQWVIDCVNKGYFLLAPTGDYFSNDFNSGLVASYIGSCAGYPYITPDGFEFNMAPAPATTWYPSWNRGPIVFYYNDDARAQGAYEFVKYFISADVNLGWVIAVNALSPYTWTQELEGYKAYVAEDSLAINALNAVGAHLDIAGSLPNVTGAATVRNVIVDAVEKAAFSGVSVQDAWNEAELLCNAALKGE